MTNPENAIKLFQDPGFEEKYTKEVNMQKKKKILMIVTAGSLILSGCKVYASENAFSEQSVPVYRDRLASDESASVRMYGDIPYMKIDDYYNGLIFTGADQYLKHTPNGTRTASSPFLTCS